jgi:hypothetical protein
MGGNRMKVIAAAFFALLGTSVAQAEESCLSKTQPVAVTSAVNADGLGNAALVTPGLMTVVALHPSREVGYFVQPEKSDGGVTYGGLVAVTIPEAGTWQVSINSRAWIDVLQNDTAVVSTAHGHAFTCSGLRKVVEFPLAQGRAVIHLSANIDSSLSVLVLRKSDAGLSSAAKGVSHAP